MNFATTTTIVSAILGSHEPILNRSATHRVNTTSLDQQENLPSTQSAPGCRRLHLLEPIGAGFIENALPVTGIRELNVHAMNFGYRLVEPLLQHPFKLDGVPRTSDPELFDIYGSDMIEHLLSLYYQFLPRVNTKKHSDGSPGIEEWKAIRDDNTLQSDVRVLDQVRGHDIQACKF